MGGGSPGPCRLHTAHWEMTGEGRLRCGLMCLRTPSSITRAEHLLSLRHQEAQEARGWEGWSQSLSASIKTVFAFIPTTSLGILLEKRASCPS